MWVEIYIVDSISRPWCWGIGDLKGSAGLMCRCQDLPPCWSLKQSNSWMFKDSGKRSRCCWPALACIMHSAELARCSPCRDGVCISAQVSPRLLLRTSFSKPSPSLNCILEFRKWARGCFYMQTTFNIPGHKPPSIATTLILNACKFCKAMTYLGIALLYFMSQMFLSSPAT